VTHNRSASDSRAKAFSKSILAPAADSGLDSSDASGLASSISSKIAFCRRLAIRNVVTAILLNQPAKAAGVSKSPSRSQARMNASWARSSASAALPAHIRRNSPRAQPCLRLTSSLNAAWFRACAATIRAASLA
jgi:hypothetical protein